MIKFLLFGLLCFFSIYSTNFYLRTTGTNSTTCFEYSNACQTIDYVLKTLLNNTNNNTVYVDTGNYTTSISAAQNTKANSFTNTSFIITGNVPSSSTFVTNDRDTYPSIVSSGNSDSFVFSFYGDDIVSFHYLKFVIGTGANTYNYYITSFFFFFFFFLF
jgi:hypothetical protein